MKKLLFLFVLQTLFMFNLDAQKIAVIDLNAVLEDMSSYKNAQAELDRLAAQWNQEIAEEYDKIKSLYNKFQAEQVLLSDEARAQREEEIVQKERIVRELQRRKFGPEGELFLKRRELINPIQERVFAAMETFARDRGYDLIFDKAGSAGILFANPEYDKTDLIKRRLASQ